MSDPREPTPQEVANAERDARKSEINKDEGLVDTLSRTADTLVKPLIDQEPDAEDLEDQRQANDAAAR